MFPLTQILRREVSEYYQHMDQQDTHTHAHTFKYPHCHYILYVMGYIHICLITERNQREMWRVERFCQMLTVGMPDVHCFHKYKQIQFGIYKHRRELFS